MSDKYICMICGARVDETNRAVLTLEHISHKNHTPLKKEELWLCDDCGQKRKVKIVVVKR